jgi:protein-tyrosine kinase
MVGPTPFEPGPEVNVLKRLPSVLRARALLALAVLTATVLAAGGAATLLPERFSATVPVLVDIAVQPGSSGDLRAARAAVLATQVDIVTSGRVALKVVDALRLAGDPTPPRRLASGAAGPASAPLRHVEADRLIERLRVVPSPASGVLAIGFRGDDPASAARLAEAFARAYIDTLGEIRVDVARRADPAGGDSRGHALSRIDAVALDVAREPVGSDGPGPLAVGAMALPVGGLLALLAVAFAEARRPRVHSVSDLQRAAPDTGVDTLREAFAGRGRAVRETRPAPTGSGVETGFFAPPGGSGALFATGSRESSTWPDTAPWPTAGAPAAVRAGSPAPPLHRADPPRAETAPSGGRLEPVFAGAIPPARSPDRSRVSAHLPERVSAGGDAADTAPVRADPPDRAADAASAPSHPSAPAGAAAAVTDPDRLPIGLLLVQAGLIHAPEVERTLAWARQEGLRFGEAAVARRLVTAEQLDRVLATQFDYPLLQPGHSAVSDEVVAAFGARNPFVTDLRRLRAALDGSVLAPSSRRSVAVVGAGFQPGRTFLAANLAVSLAQAGRRTLLIDADLRGGRVHMMFGLHNRSGLASMLNRRIEPGALQRVSGLGALTVIACGPRAPNPAELLSRDSFGQLLASFRRAFDAVVLDTSGADGEPDARLVARAAGAALLVTRRGITGRAEVGALAGGLHDDRVVLAAALLNRH